MLTACCYKQIYANASSVPTNLGGGQHGHLGITMTAANYLAVAPLTPAFVIPVLPAAPAIAGMTAANARQAQTDYEEAKDAHQAQTEIEALLKQQILTALNQDYLSPLSHDTVGFLNVSTLDMLTHLEDTYGADERVLLI